IRPAFLAAFRPLALRRSSMALSMSPSASTNAFLQSIMPRPVRSRSSLTIPAVILAILLPLQMQKNFNYTNPISKKRGVAPLFLCHVAGNSGAGCSTTFAGSCSVSVADFDELAVTANRIKVATPFDAGIGYSGSVQLDGANGVIISGDREVDTVGVAVGVDHADDRNAQVVGFGDGNTLVVHIDHEQRIRQAAHVLDTPDAALKLLFGTTQHQCFFLGQTVESTVLLLGCQVAQALDRATDGFVVGQHAAEPAVINIRHASALRLLLDDLASSTLGAYEQYLLLARGEILDLVQRGIHSRYGVFEVDDMNLVAGAEDELLHFRVPVAGLVTEVDTGLEHVFH